MRQCPASHLWYLAIPLTIAAFQGCAHAPPSLASRAESDPVACALYVARSAPPTGNAERGIALNRVAAAAIGCEGDPAVADEFWAHDPDQLSDVWVLLERARSLAARAEFDSCAWFARRAWGRAARLHSQTMRSAVRTQAAERLIDAGRFDEVLDRCRWVERRGVANEYLVPDEVRIRVASAAARAGDENAASRAIGDTRSTANRVLARRAAFRGRVPAFAQTGRWPEALAHADSARASAACGSLLDSDLATIAETQGRTALGDSLARASARVTLDPATDWSRGDCGEPYRSPDWQAAARFVVTHGEVDEALAHLRPAGGGPNEIQLRVSLERWIAIELFHHGEWAAAERVFDEAAEASLQLGSDVWLQSSLWSGWVQPLRNAGWESAARAALDSSLTLARGIADGVFRRPGGAYRAEALARIAVAAGSLWSDAQAQAVLLEALTIARRIPEPYTQATTIAAIGAAYRSRGTSVDSTARAILTSIAQDVRPWHATLSE